jgi:hypothetical protein
MCSRISGVEYLPRRSVVTQRVLGNVDRQAGLVGELLQLELPQACPDGS